MQFDTIIRGGRVVSPDSIATMDIGIVDGRVACLAVPGALPEAQEEIDAAGRLVLPGLVDAHVHFCLPFMGTTTNDDFYRGSISAAAGGVTTVVDFAIQEGREDPLETIAKRRAQGDGHVVIDYALHACLTDPRPATVERIPKIIDQGLPTFKVFMIYRKQGWMVEDGLLLDIIRLARDHGGLVGVHSENAAMCDYNVDLAVSRGQKAPIYHSRTKPNVTEAEAINRAMFLAQSAGAPLYDFHMSVREGVEMFRRTRSAGLPFYAETCHRYLILTEDALNRPEGFNFICSPPLRVDEDIEALWEGIADGSVSVVASDHCAYSAEQKRPFSDSFEQVPNGFEGVESLLPVTYAEGVGKGRITVQKLVEVCAANPARILGLYPRKGVLAAGSDADLVILNPEREEKITAAGAALGNDWNPYEGRSFRGWPELTMSRGVVVWRDGKFTGRKGHGQFLQRSIPAEVLTRPV